MALAYNTKIPTRGLVFCVDPANKNSVKPDKNILDISGWIDGSTGSTTGYNMNGTTSENSRVWGTDPWGYPCILWESISAGDSGPSGGWGTPAIPIDNTQTYRFSVWMRRTVSGNGTSYIGTNGLDSSMVNTGVLNSAGNINTNPYFATRSAALMPENQWTLWVGHVRPHDFTPWYSAHPDTGIWALDGSSIASATDFKWQIDNTHTIHRTYLYYSTDTTTTQHWCYPRLDLCDGTEPSLAELLSGKDVTLRNLRRGINDVRLLNAPRHEGSVLDFNGTTQYGKTATVGLVPNMTWVFAVNREFSNNSYNMMAGSILPYFCIRDTNAIMFANNINGDQSTVYSDGPHLSNSETDGQWFILAFRSSYNPAANETTSSIFRNGELCGESTFPGQQTPNTNDFLLMDNRDDTSTDYKMKGKMGYAAVHHASLTDDEIRQYFNALRVRYGI